MTDKEIKKTNRLNVPKKARIEIKLEAVAERKKRMELYEKALKEKFDEVTAKEAGLYGDRPVVPKPGTRTNNG